MLELAFIYLFMQSDLGCCCCCFFPFCVWDQCYAFELYDTAVWHNAILKYNTLQSWKALCPFNTNEAMEGSVNKRPVIREDLIHLFNIYFSFSVRQTPTFYSNHYIFYVAFRKSIIYILFSILSVNSLWNVCSEQLDIYIHWYVISVGSTDLQYCIWVPKKQQSKVFRIVIFPA